MKITLTQENLNHALSIVSRVASSRTDLPILANILLRTDNGKLLVASTNLEVAISETVSAKIEEPGEITIPARLITDFVANLPHVNIDISTNENKVEITAGGFNSVINSSSADDFPALPEVVGDNKFTIKADHLRDAIAGTANIASADATRPILTGVYVYSSDKKLYFAATDGYRLAEKRSIDIDQEVSLLIPASTLQDLSRVLSDDDKNIEIRFDTEQVSFITDNIIITSRLIDGNFIDYRKLIPKDTEFSAEVDRAEFIKISKVAGLFSSSTGSVIIKTSEKDNQLSMQSLASEIGENSSTLDADVKGDGVISLNSKFLLDGLNSISGERVKMQFSGKLAPVLLTGKNDDYKHIIMPVKS